MAVSMKHILGKSAWQVLAFYRLIMRNFGRILLNNYIYGY
jgi:hypothetical protein